MNTTFISYSLATQDRYILNLLATKLNEIGFQLASTSLPGGIQVSTYTLSEIQNASFVMGLITLTGQSYQQGVVAQEINAARQMNKPVVLLIEEGVNPSGVLQDFPNTVFFNRQNIPAAIEQVKTRITGTDNSAAWLLGGIAALALLAYLSSDKK